MLTVSFGQKENVTHSQYFPCNYCLISWAVEGGKKGGGRGAWRYGNVP